ncbi:MAG: Tim44/TimA family putative adaptor protein, partial [Rhodospirillaceae bacterium]|nr:Tim44/TimA family putative adaptor protein [Rhodospirillaceae bacterium]
MGNGIQFLDIIFFALIAAFLVLRLRNVLGKRDGHQRDQNDQNDPFNLGRPPQAGNENVVSLPEREDSGAFEELVNSRIGDEDAAEIDQQDPLAVGLTQIMRADKSFEVEDFLVGARTAFEMIIGGFASGDTDMLQA